jgi:hypothetical protein
MPELLEVEGRPGGFPRPHHGPAPADAAAIGDVLAGARWIRKRIVFEWSGGTIGVPLPMLTGRPGLEGQGCQAPGKASLIAFDMKDDDLALTEQGSKRRVSLYAYADEFGLAEHDPGVVEPLEVEAPTLAAALTDPPRMVMRALSDPHNVPHVTKSGSDESPCAA